jgi:signal transduction histidine kinase
MRGQARFGALGLRGRIIGVVLVTAAAALAVAAATLLSQLESSLKEADQRALTHELQGAAKPHQVASAAKPFEKLNPGDVIYTALLPPLRDGKPPRGSAALIAKGEQARDRLADAANRVQSRVGASAVIVLGYPDADGTHPQAVLTYPTKGAPAPDLYTDAVSAFRTGDPRYTPGTIGGTEYARAAIPFTAGGQRWVLAVRKPLNEVGSAVAAVRTAIFHAALVAAALTLLLAIPFAGTLVRRLRLLRQTALRVAHEGPNVEIPVDRALDEVGDLARTFALMQQQLRRQEEARRAFVATASHELRTPVASLDGLLELLDEDLQSGQTDLEDARSMISRARAQSRRLGRLAADLLDLSRIDAQTDLRSEPVELGELSRAVLAEFEMGVSRRGIATVLDDGGGSVWALGDPGSVARIVRILLDNAVRLSPEGGEIKVELRNGDRASLSVCDQGPGVPAEEREMIFERFMRGREAGGRAGFGLGLAIGRELANRMGGELVLEDNQRGARFTLRLPVARAPQEEPVALA